MNLDHVFLVDKPAGWTSFDVVAKIRGAIQGAYRAKTGERRKIKVGHTGTLDPLATGLLVVVTGKNTKKVPELIKQDKTYEVELTLGATSTTGDAEGTITKLHNKQPTEEQLKEVIASFIGTIEQTPPTYSAIKVNGKRAYELARAGKQVKLEPRQVVVQDISDVKYIYPVVQFTVNVSSGTYIRSLGSDIGEKLGVGAYMSALRRTEVGRYSVADSCSVEDIVKLLQN